MEVSRVIARKIHFPISGRRRAAGEATRPPRLGTSLTCGVGRAPLRRPLLAICACRARAGSEPIARATGGRYDSRKADTPTY
jgi:hypothetical protein